MKYIIQAATVGDDNVVEIPDEGTPLNVFYHPTTGVLNVAVLMPELMSEEPEEGKEEEESTEEKPE